ncbi:unnamed protein product [Urochloa humidicola]
MKSSTKAAIVLVVGTMVVLQLMVPAPAMALSLGLDSSQVTVSKLEIGKLLQGYCIDYAFGSCDVYPCCPPLFEWMHDVGLCNCLDRSSTLISQHAAI